MLNWFIKLKQNHPVATWLAIQKFLTITLGIFGMWLTLTPTLSFSLKALILIGVNVSLLPMSYWLTYGFERNQ